MPRIKFKPHNQIPYAIAPVQLKVLPGIRERLREVDGWQARIRAEIDLLIQEDENRKGVL